MNTNSPSDSRSAQVWELLHGAAALVSGRGFISSFEPLPSKASGGVVVPRSVPYGDVVEKYRDRLALGASFPPGWGSPTPLALLITRHELSPGETEFVRNWFVNAKIQYPLEEYFWVQPLPAFVGEAAPYRAFFEELCRCFQPRAVFSLGPEPARLLLGAPLSLDTLRGGDFRLASWSLLTTLDPTAYFALPEDPPEDRKAFKGQVWKDVQRLVGKLKYA